MNQVPEHRSFPGHGTNVITCLQFDADKIVSASDDHSMTICVFDPNTGQLRRRLDGHEGGVWALEYKGNTLVSGSTDMTVRVWDLETLSETHVFYGHTSTVRCVQIVEPVLDQATGEYQPPYPMIVTGSRDADLRVWKLPKKGEPSVFPEGESSLETFPPEQNPWHVHHLKGHTQAVRALAAYGRYCVSGSYDHTVRVWDIVTGQCKRTMTGHEQKVYSIVYDKQRDRCASGSMDNTVKIWDVLTGECLHSLTGHTSLVGLLGISPNFLVSGAADGSIRIWDANSYELKHALVSSGAVTCFQHDDTRLVSGSEGTLKLWDIRTGQCIRDLLTGVSAVWQVAFKDNLLVAASSEGVSTTFDVFSLNPDKTV